MGRRRPRGACWVSFTRDQLALVRHLLRWGIREGHFVSPATADLLAHVEDEAKRIYVKETDVTP